MSVLCQYNVCFMSVLCQYNVCLNINNLLVSNKIQLLYVGCQYGFRKDMKNITIRYSEKDMAFHW